MNWIKREDKRNMDCIFCKIIAGTIPSYTVYEDELVKVFLDINPSTKGDMLIVPKKHIVNGNELVDELVLHIHKIVNKLYQELKEKLNMEGLTLAVNSGCAQEIKHYHMHFTPRYENDKGIYTFDKTLLMDLSELMTIIKTER